MNGPTRRLLNRYLDAAYVSARTGWRVLRTHGPSQVQFWFIALGVGVAAGLAALLFRMGIDAAQATLYGVDDPRRLHSFAATLPWWLVMAVPVAGGLAVGAILTRFTPDGRVCSVADVIEGAALHEGRVARGPGAASAAASLITLSSGGSTGREGPVVHLAGVIASWVSDRINANGITGRDLLGCGVAAAVSASFNAPIAGALFALEVVLRHFAVHAFAPIVIASVAGTVINRLRYGDVTEFTRPPEGGALGFYVELPAFLLLGLVSGLVAVAMMRAMFAAEDAGDRLQARTGLPAILRPAVAGLLLGAIAVAFPHIIGVGYETTSAALTGALPLGAAILFASVKTVAVAITVAGRMGGGVFSPSLMVGALTGLAFGYLATGLFPAVSGSATLYALAGMGAVAAAVLGAPISTTLIVFELTGDWQTGLAVMVSVSLSTALASRMVDRSYFLTQLERRDSHLAPGPQAWVLSLHTVGEVMRPKGTPGAASPAACRELIAQGVALPVAATLGEAIEAFEESGHSFLPVIGAVRPREGTPELLGALYHVDALAAYADALAETAAEEHA